MGMKTFMTGGMEHNRMIVEDIVGGQIKTVEDKSFTNRDEMLKYAHSIKDNGHYKIVMSSVTTSNVVWYDEYVE